MKKILLLFLFNCCLSLAHAQSGHVNVHLNKALCYPADTVRFEAYLFGSAPSGPLFVELYDDQDRLVSRGLFPVEGGSSTGQLIMPSKSGLFWLRCYTPSSAFTFQSLTIRDRDRPVTIRKATFKTLPLTDTLGLRIESRIIRRYLSVSVFVRPGSPMTGRSLRFSFDYAGNGTKSYNLQLSSDTVLVKNIRLTDLQGYLGLSVHENEQLFARQDITVPKVSFPFNLSRIKGQYTLSNPDSGSCHYSLSIMRSDQPVPASFYQSIPGFLAQTDTGSLTIRTAYPAYHAPDPARYETETLPAKAAPERATLLWAAQLDQHPYTFRLPQGSYRLLIEGIAADGTAIYAEQMAGN